MELPASGSGKSSDKDKGASTVPDTAPEPVTATEKSTEIKEKIETAATSASSSAAVPTSTSASAYTNGTPENWDPALSRLLTSLKDVQLVGEDVTFLSELLQSKQLHALVQVHNKIVAKGKDEKFCPLLSNSMQITIEVLEELAKVPSVSKQYDELLGILQKPHFQAILCTHDAVAQKDFFPHLPDLPIDGDEEETVKIVQLVKSDEPLGGAQGAEPIVGATIKTDEDTGKIVIARVMHGGAADRSGLIHAGDQVIEVNGIPVEDKTPADVLVILQNSEGTITFKLVPSYVRSGNRESKVRVRALFDYDPANDPFIPCKEAGLEFRRGSVLHIVSQDDTYWWQARREGDRIMRAGLIPSRSLQEGRITHERQVAPPTHDGDKSKASGSKQTTLCAQVAAAIEESRAVEDVAAACSSTPKVKKVLYDTAEAADFERDGIPTYEEVARLYPRPGFIRPLILVGATGVGRNELRRRLLATDPTKYCTPTPVTSRPQKSNEMSGRDYVFTTREKMERDIDAGKYIEYGEYKGNLYGTTAEAVECVIHSGRICILSPHWQALKMLRTGRLRPYIVCITPPPLERLKNTRSLARAKSSFDKEASRPFTDAEFENIVRNTKRLLFNFGHLFDECVLNDDIGEAVGRLLRIVWKLQSEPLWVPATWVQ